MSRKQGKKSGKTKEKDISSENSSTNDVDESITESSKDDVFTRKEETRDHFSFSFLVKLFTELTSRNSSFTVTSKNKYLIGAKREIIDQAFVYKLKRGDWSCIDYYDHEWSMFCYYNDLDVNDESLELTFNRYTIDTADYGFIEESALKKYLKSAETDAKEEDMTLEEYLEDLDQIDLNYVKGISFVTFGRGDTSMSIYTLEKKGLVYAFLLTYDDIGIFSWGEEEFQTRFLHEKREDTKDKYSISTLLNTVKRNSKESVKNLSFTVKEKYPFFIGSEDEIKDHKFGYKLKEGEWKGINYNNKAVFCYLKGINKKKKVTFERYIPKTKRYGFVEDGYESDIYEGEVEDYAREHGLSDLGAYLTLSISEQRFDNEVTILLSKKSGNMALYLLKEEVENTSSLSDRYSVIIRAFLIIYDDIDIFD